MNKLRDIAIIVFIVVAAYLILLVFQMVIVDAAATANTTMAATSNMSNYPGTAEAVISAPWVLWFVPGTVGMAAVIIRLKRP